MTVTISDFGFRNLGIEDLGYEIWDLGYTIVDLRLQIADFV